MLQKEASTLWNAYKYALILPVMLIFLYSFNVVKEIEYIPMPTDEATVELYGEDDNWNDLVFDINTTTTKKQLTEYADRISQNTDVTVKFEKVKHENNMLKSFMLASKFEGRSWNNNMEVSLDANDLFLLRAMQQEVWLNNTITNDTFKITKNGTVLETEELLYQNDEAGQNVFDMDALEFTTGSIVFKIVNTTTDESLADFKKQLKETYNVDFKYSGIKRRDGKIRAIKLELDDNRGTQIKQSYKDDDAIDDICINGEIEDESRSWSMGDCGNSNTFIFSGSGQNALSNLSAYGFTTDSLTVIMDANMRKLDSIYGTNGFSYKFMDMDSLSNLSNIWIEDLNIDMDSIIDVYDLSPEKKRELEMKVQEMYEMYNHIEEPVLQNQIRKRIHSEINSPLIMLNGKKSDSDINNIDPEHIESITVLKDKEATSLYGKAAENGVVLIVTDPDKREKYEALRDSMNLKRKEIIEIKKVEMDARKEQMRAQREIRKAQLEAQREVRKELMEARKEQLEAQKEQRKALMKQRRAVLAKEGIYSIRSSDSIRVISGEPNIIVQGYSTSGLEDFYLDDVSKEGFAQLEKQLEEAGHSFELKTHRMRGGKLKKLKFSVNGNSHTMEANRGVKYVNISIDKNGKPSVSMESN